MTRVLPARRRGAKTRIGALALAALFITGCSAESTPQSSPSEVTREITMTRPPTATASTPPPVTITVPPSSEPSATASQAPTSQVPVPTLTWPDAEAGSCPYITNEEAGKFNGQGLGQTYIRPLTPHPVCDFFRSDGGWSASVAVVVTDSDAEAVAVVNAAAPIDDSDPAELNGGWTGGSWVKEEGADPEIFQPEELAVYAVSKGPIAVIATSNEPLTKKARNFVFAAITALEL